MENQTKKIEKLTLKIDAQKKQISAYKLVEKTLHEMLNIMQQYKVSKVEHAKVLQTITPSYRAYVARVMNGEVLHPNGYSGSGRHTRKTSDKCYAISQLLTLNNIAHVCGNDAPRGGHSGYFVRLKTIADFEQEKIQRIKNITATITIDDQFKEDMQLITGKNGQDKSDRQANAFSALLVRQGITIPNEDNLFWQAFRAVNNIRKALLLQP